MADIVETDEKVDIIPDPGQQEGSGKKDPKVEQDNIPPESTRFKEVYAKSKQYERLFNEVNDKYTKQESLINEMRAWNEKLSGQIGDAITTIADSKSDDKSADKVTALQSSLEVLKSDYANAIKDLDYDKATDIMDKMTDVKLDIKEAKSAPKKEEPKPSNKVDPNLQPYVDFVKTTEWYEDNPHMALYAQQMEAIVNTSSKWVMKSVSEKLAEVKRLTEEHFQWKPSGNGSGNNASAGGAAAVDTSRHSGSGGTQNVSLTSEEEELVKGLGISREKFLSQKRVTMQNSKRRK